MQSKHQCRKRRKPLTETATGFTLSATKSQRSEGGAEGVVTSFSLQFFAKIEKTAVKFPCRTFRGKKLAQRALKKCQKQSKTAIYSAKYANRGFCNIERSAQVLFFFQKISRSGFWLSNFCQTVNMCSFSDVFCSFLDNKWRFCKKSFRLPTSLHLRRARFGQQKSKKFALFFNL